MKEKIDELAKGIFKSDSAVLKIEPSYVELAPEAGTSCSGSFVISNDKGRSMRGKVCADCHYVELEQDSFQGEEVEIKFHFDARHSVPGEVIKGSFVAITDCGSATVRFSAAVAAPTFVTSAGKIKDLFQFANFAKEHEREAVSIFKSGRFEDVFLYRDARNINLYRGLCAGSGKSLAMEEFLIAARKKLPVQFTVNATSFSYGECAERFMDEVVITKDNWGFAALRIKSDAAFVQPEHKIIWTDGFTGNSFRLSFLVDPEKMANGKNYAKIEISTARQNIEIGLTAVKACGRHDEVSDRIAVQEKIHDLIKAHLDFSMGRIEKSEYASRADDIARGLAGADARYMAELLRVHAAMLDNRDRAVSEGLARLDAASAQIYKTDKKQYCAYLYLKGLWAGSEKEKKECIRKINECYTDKEHSWQLLWLLLYLDDGYGSDRKKFEDISAHLREGCRSPLMYFEICSILNDSPERLTDLNPQLIQCLHWGCSNNYLEKETALRYAYHAGRLKYFSELILGDLTKLYERYPEDEILSVICGMYMKGQMTSEEAFGWYSLGIEKNLKITDLYEYYMYSVREGDDVRFSQSILLYFLYDNHLLSEKKAMLYAYVIKNKGDLPDTYESYKESIREFCFSQLRQGHVGRNLAVIYEEFINEEAIDDEVAGELPAVMFAHEVICTNPEIVGAYVRHMELEREEYVPLVNGRAIVRLFTENAAIFLADGSDGRYAVSIDYTVNKLVNLDHLAKKCFEKNKTDVGLLLHLCDKSSKAPKYGGMVPELASEAVKMDGISRYLRRKALSSLIKYYYDNFEGELLDEALDGVSWEDVAGSDRPLFIECCAVRRRLDKAMEGLLLFGYGKVPAKRLLQISSPFFEKSLDDKNLELLRLAAHIFKEGDFDENSLLYLCRHFWGGMDDEIRIWRAAKGFGIDCLQFEERVVSQAIFTEEIFPETYDVFYSYCEKGSNRRIIAAFLGLLAYKHLARGWILPNEIYKYFYEEARQQENMPCAIASLKFLSEKEELSDEEAEFADYNVNALCEKNIIFSFYKKFYGKIALPARVADGCYVEYAADPDCEVKIHYLISSSRDNADSDKKFAAEIMQNVFGGIRTRGFVLFKDELLQCYISETDSEGEKITKSFSKRYEKAWEGEKENKRRRSLNEIMAARESNDDEALIGLMKDYAAKREGAKRLFKALP